MYIHDEFTILIKSVSSIAPKSGIGWKFNALVEVGSPDLAMLVTEIKMVPVSVLVDIVVIQRKNVGGKKWARRNRGQRKRELCGVARFLNS